MVGHTGTPTRTVCVDMTLTRSKVKVNVTEHLNFHISRSISSATFAWSSKLMIVADGMGPGL